MSDEIPTPPRPGRERFSQDFSGGSKTKQEFKEECDINNILRHWTTTGQAPHTRPFPPTYGDFTSATDYYTSVNLVKEAESEFGALPAEVRDRFKNNPQELMLFLSDPKNQEEAVKLGLAQAPPEPLPSPPAAVAATEPATPPAQD